MDAPMNITAIFISRPVMTTLVMLGIVLFGSARLPLPAGQRSAERRFPDDSGDRQPAGRESRDHGSLGGHAAGAPVLHHCRPRFDDLHELPGDPRASPCNSRWTARSMPPLRMCRSAIAAAARDCRRACRLRPPSEGQPGRPADPLSVAQLADPAALGSGRVRRDHDLAAHLHDQRAWPR